MYRFLAKSCDIDSRQERLFETRQPRLRYMQKFILRETKTAYQLEKHIIQLN